MRRAILSVFGEGQRHNLLRKSLYVLVHLVSRIVYLAEMQSKGTIKTREVDAFFLQIVVENALT
jgi:hypothetical protein